MSETLDFSTILKALDNASAFELFRLKHAIELSLDDPARIKPIMAAIRPGMETTFFDWTENRERDCTIIEIKRKQVCVRTKDDGRRWEVPCYMLNINGVDTTIRQNKSQGMSRQELSIGMNVGFQDNNGQPIVGRIKRLNPKTVTIAVPGGQWRVGYSHLYPIIDGESVEQSTPEQIELIPSQPRTENDSNVRTPEMEIADGEWADAEQ